LTISAFLIPLDYAMLLLAGIFVYYLRFNALVSLRPVIYEIHFGRYFVSLLIIFLAWLGIFALAGLYSLNRKRHFSREFSQIFLACSVGTMLIVLFVFFRGEYFSSRFIVLAGWLMTIIFVNLGRILTHFFQLACYRRGWGLEPILIFGSSELARKISVYLENNRGSGYKVLGNPRTIEELLENWSPKAYDVSQIIQVEPHLEREHILRLVEFCNEHQIIFKYAADIFDALSSNVRTETLAGVPIIVIQKTALNGWGRVVKRIADLIGGFFILIFFSPLFALVAVIIKMDSPGPVFVKLPRVGERGRKIGIYKFRSMVKGASRMKKDLFKYNERKDGPLFKMKNDPRITRFGRILRRTSLDELPQVINVLKGEMSLVGPRPHEPEEVAQYQKRYKQLLTIKPGMTGLAQISGRSKLSFEEEFNLDVYYVENWSLMFDLQIMFKTIPVVFSARDAF